MPFALLAGSHSDNRLIEESLKFAYDMAPDHGYHFAAQALPTPTDTPYDSPSMDISKQSSRQGSSSPISNYSPTPFPPSEESYFPKQQMTIDDGSVDWASPHDSRRYIPNNLGISLVSQIHSLGKELGSKNSMVENLEDYLHKSRAENEQLTRELRVEKAEVTSITKQMQSLENDMLRALEGIAKERDNALDTVADTRKRLDDSKKKIRAQEEDANKVHALWEKDRESWDDKRRKMESRVHMVEERLKTMVAEMLIVQNSGQTSLETGNDVDEGVHDTCFGKSNDTSCACATSRLSNWNLDEPHDGKLIPSVRPFRRRDLHSLGGAQMSGLSLAAELELGEEEDDAKEEDIDQDALLDETSISLKPYPEDQKVKKVMGFHADNTEDFVGDEASGQHSIGIINDYIDFPGNKLGTHYTDTSTQSSPPPSPTPQAREPGVPEKPNEQTERAANQSRKRIAIPRVFAEQTPASRVAEPKASSTISPGSQTIERPEDLIWTSKATSETPFTVLKSASTQTIEDATAVSNPANSSLLPPPTDVPVIAIHPPASRPSWSRNSVMLPPRTKNAACQVVIELPRITKSTSMQTDETRIDKRPVRIPPSLQSSEVSIQPPPQLAERGKMAGKIPGLESSRRNLRSPPPIRAEETQSSTRIVRTKTAYSGDNDNGRLNNKQLSNLRRPIRSGSILAGFDLSSDDDPEITQDHFSDDEFLSAAPIRKTLSKVQNAWKLVPHIEDSVLERLESASEGAEDEKHANVPKAASAKAKASSQSTFKTTQIRPGESFRKASSNVKQPDIRRKALVSNGIIGHAQRGRSPSKLNFSGKEPAIAPPFPVPKRSSSRVIPLGARDEAASPSPQTTTFFSARHGQEHGRPLIKRRILRKVQSAAAVTQPLTALRPQLRQSLSASSTRLSSPKSPLLRHNQFMSPYESVAEIPDHSTPSRTRGKTSVEMLGEQTSVVDAITQTMVGEWMWKYVRKRSSFGITETPQAEFEMGRNGDTRNGNGVRHKRWVRLAPHERSVIWNSKQPTAGSALLGKGCRKRMLTFKISISMR